jgi:uncharacterized membrane-anchored protein
MKQKNSGAYSYTAFVAADRKTKQLCKRLHSHQIALIDHADVDEMAARSLMDAGVQAVINLSDFAPSSGSGHFAV